MNLKDIPKPVRVKYGILFATTVLVLILDQWTKVLVHKHFRWGESREVISSVFALTYVRNNGAAFGLLNHAPAYFRDPFFIIVPLLALTMILVVFYRLPAQQKATAISLSLILGGAVGNLIDRLHFGFVVDFLDLHWKEVYHWPAFNVADSSIVVGVAVLFVLSVLQEAKASKQKHRPETAAEPNNAP